MDAKKLAEQSSREMESLLQCPICIETFSKPVVILPCQHNLCRQCAEDCFDQRGTRFGINGGRFKCPTCRYEVILDRHGIFGLPRNLLIEQIIDMMDEDKKRVEQQFKDKIAEEEKKLNELKAKEIKVQEQKMEKLCPDHKETLNVYCLSCAKLICATCKVFGECQTCTVVKTSEAYNQQQSELQEAIELTTQSTDRVHSAISHCNELKHRTDDVDAEARKQLISQFEKITQALEDKKKQLLAKITNVTQETNRTLLNSRNKYDSALGKASNDIAEALGLAQEPDQITFLISCFYAFFGGREGGAVRKRKKSKQVKKHYVLYDEL